MRSLWLFSAVLSALLLFGMQHYIIQHGFFYTFPWVDTPLHVLGGITLGLLTALYVGERRAAYWVSVFVLVVVWEIFESAMGLPQPPHYLLDTVHDIINGLLGSGLVYLIARKTLWVSN